MNKIFTFERASIDWLQLLFAGLAIVAGSIGGVLVLGLDRPILIFAGIVALIGVIVVMAYPEWGLIGLGFMTYTNFSDALISSVNAPSTAQPYIALLIATIAARAFLLREIPRGWLVATFLIGLYAFSGALSLFYARNFDLAVEGVSDFLKLSIICVIIVMMMNNATSFRRMIWMLIGVGAFLGSLSTIQYLTGTFDNSYAGFARPPIVHFEDGDTTLRVAGPLGDPNFYGQAMIFLLPLSLDRLWNERSWLLRGIALWSLVATILAIFFTFSRGTFLAGVIGVVMMVMFLRSNPMVLFAIAIAAVLALPFVPTGYIDRLSSIADVLPSDEDAGVADESFRGRTSEMLSAWRMFRDNPVLGVGIGNYNAHYLDYSREIGLDPRRIERSAHSLYLEIAAERGLVGLVIFAIILGTIFRSLYTSFQQMIAIGMKQESSMIAAVTFGFIAFLFAAIFLHDAFPRYFWMIAGICLALPKVVHNETERLKAPAFA